MAASDALYLGIVEELVPVFEELGAQYQVRVPGVYDPDTMTTGEPTARYVVGLVADEKTAIQFGSAGAMGGRGGEAENANWISTKNLILTSTANPQPGEDVLVDGKWYPLSNVQRIKPADITIVYILDVSK